MKIGSLKMNKYILDACALIVFLNDEEGSDLVEELLKTKSTIIHIINLYEVYYDYKRSHSDELKCKHFFFFLTKLPFRVESRIDYCLIETAAFFKVNYSISFADSFALSLAKNNEAKLVTSDHHEFDSIEKDQVISFKWLR